MASQTNSQANGSPDGELGVLVIAPNLGSDLAWVSEVDPRVKVLDGNDGQGQRDALLAQAEVLLVGFPVPPVLVAHAPRLRWAHHTQAGVSNLHDSDLWGSGVTITSTRGHVTSTAIAEYAIGAAFHFARGLHEATRQKAAGEFIKEEYELRPLNASTMGVVGLGGIGGEVARLARALGMRVVATRHSVSAPQRDAEGVDLLLPADRLDELAAESDFVAVCVQLTDETRGMLNERVFTAMKPDGVVINVARGEVVDEDALVRALETGEIRGAVLDVYDGELHGRPPRREFLELPQVVLTPHISGRGDVEIRERARRLFAANLRRFIDDEPLVNVVDPARGY